MVQTLAEVLGPEFDFRFGDLIPHFSEACSSGLIRALCSLQIEDGVDPMQWKFTNKYITTNDIRWFIYVVSWENKDVYNNRSALFETLMSTYKFIYGYETLMELPVQNAELLDLILCIQYGVGNVVTSNKQTSLQKDAITSYLDRTHPNFRSEESLAPFTTVNVFGRNLVHSGLTTAAINMNAPNDYCLLVFPNEYYRLCNPIGNTILPRHSQKGRCDYKNLGKRCTLATAFIRCYLHRRAEMLQYRSSLVA